MADVPAQVEITRAEATLVNGRMSGIIKNSSDNDLNGKCDIFTFLVMLNED